MKKRTVCTVSLFLAAVIFAGCIFFRLNSRAKMWQQEAAEMNFSYWNELAAMTVELEKADLNEEKLKEYLLYINGIVFACTSHISPEIKGSGESLNNNFLRSDYYGLAHNIVSEVSFFSQAKRQYGTTLFREMTAELGTLAFEVCNIEYKNRSELLNENSAVYRETQKRINAFCDKYREKIHMLEVLYG